MNAPKAIFVVVGLNVLQILAFATCMFLLPRLHSQDFSGIRTKVETSPSFEDLRPRALQAVLALTSADSAIRYLHEVAVRLAVFGIALAVLNSLLLGFLLSRIPPP
jgi:hypothetical protein